MKTKEHLSRHKTTRMAIKVAEVDVAMVPIIQWMNEQSFTLTMSCCHGEERTTAHKDRPYITFLTTMPRQLHEISNTIHSAGLVGDVQLELFYIDECRLYRLTFKNRRVVRQYAKFLKEYGAHHQPGDLEGAE